MISSNLSRSARSGTSVSSRRFRNKPTRVARTSTSRSTYGDLCMACQPFSSNSKPLIKTTTSTCVLHLPTQHHHQPAQPQAQQPVVSTYRRRRIPTRTSESHRIPLSIVDIHLRHEQLPFGYFFDETLDERALEQSLRAILRDFPQLGGRICRSHTAIACHPDDAVELSFGRINMTMEEWQSQQRGHTLQSACTTTKKKSNNNHNSNNNPILLPLFESLFQNDQDTSLVKIRVTYFQNHGTAIGVTVCHALGDTATCVHFVQSWGKQMRQKVYQKVATDRSKACLSGMMTLDIADIMGLTTTTTTTSTTNTNTMPDLYAHYVPDFLRDWIDGSVTPVVLDDPVVAISAEPIAFVETVAEPVTPTTIPQIIPALQQRIDHEYVRLPFSPALLQSLKEMGASSCLQDNMIQNGNKESNFVSTNDMVTAFGWLMKRHLSQHNSHNISMVVNLRGRSGVDPTLFGNGITHVVATLPETTYVSQQPQQQNYTAECWTETLCQAAKSIRTALQLGLSDLDHALFMSQTGRAVPAPANSTQSFSTTSWGQFPLYKVRFAQHAISGFHGHPAHPLPAGRTFASVITPCPEGGVWYEMLVPSDRAALAREMHAEMAAVCLAWRQQQQPQSMSGGLANFAPDITSPPSSELQKPIILQ